MSILNNWIILWDGKQFHCFGPWKVIENWDSFVRLNHSWNCTILCPFADVGPTVLIQGDTMIVCILYHSWIVCRALRSMCKGFLELWFCSACKIIVSFLFVFCFFHSSFRFVSRELLWLVSNLSFVCYSFKHQSAWHGYLPFLHFPPKETQAVVNNWWLFTLCPQPEPICHYLATVTRTHVQEAAVMAVPSRTDSSSI